MLPAALALVIFGAASPAVLTLTEGTNFQLDVAADGRIAIDLLGSLWVVPPSGGNAEAITGDSGAVHRPRWSPDGERLLFEKQTVDGQRLFTLSLADGSVRSVGAGTESAYHADWHPDGERIVFVSDRAGAGLDVWETHLGTELSWRLTAREGNETEPVWSGDGRDLLYIHEHEGHWALRLREFGEPERVLFESRERLSAPSWRPDGSLVTFLKEGPDGLSLEMLILSDPPLHRTLIRGEDLFVAPVAWRGADTFFYAANGVIRERNFNSFASVTLPFRATIEQRDAPATQSVSNREIELADAPSGRFVVRAARLADVAGAAYRDAADIVIEEGRIAAIESRRDRPGAVLYDLGDVTALAGLIDLHGRLPADIDPRLGPLLLTFGMTTIVANHPDAARLNAEWAGADNPGPRVLPASDLGSAAEDARPWLLTFAGDGEDAALASAEAFRSAGVPILAENWQAGLAIGATLVYGFETLPTSPAGRRYQDLALKRYAGPFSVVSGLADAGTPGLDALLESRQAALLPLPVRPLHRFPEPPRINGGVDRIVLGSAASGLPPGLGLQAELRALVAAGLSPAEALATAGPNAAAVLGAGNRIGTLEPGAFADLVLVDGDPLSRIEDALKVVAVVRNGRFFSAIGLIERTPGHRAVE